MIIDHKDLIADKRRCLAYKKAIGRAVKKGDVVVDIGAGSGLLSFFAAKVGATKVYAIEKNDIIEDAKRVARDNNLSKHIVFIKGLSSKVRIPQRADVIISEIVGHFGINERIVSFLIDAKKRFLKKGGKIIPSSLTLHIAPVEAADIYKKEIGFWNKNLYGLDFSRVQKTAVNSLFVKSFKPEQIVAKDAVLYRIDFNQRKFPDRFFIDKNLSFRIKKDAVFHGLCGWFTVKLYDRVSLSNSPFLQALHWQNVFFPVAKPFVVKKNSLVHISINVQPFYDRFLWTWEVSSKNKTKERTFCQSSFNSFTLSDEWIARWDKALVR